MDTDSLLDELEQIQKRKLAHLSQPDRPYFTAADLSQKRAALIIGARGVGKTTLLLKYCTALKLLYLPADHPLASGTTLWELGQSAFQRGYAGLAIDEVHYAKGWAQHLKAIYDSYPDKQLFVSDSSSLVLRQNPGDLSRRFPRIHLPLLSFREFLFLKHTKSYSSFNVLESRESLDLLEQATSMSQWFREYLKIGLRPIFLEGDYEEKLLNIVEKTIFSDVPFLLPQVKDQYLRVMNAIIGYLARSPVPTLNIDKLSNEWSIGKEKLYELLRVLEHIQLINIVRLKNDKKASGKGAKIFLADPSLYSILNGNVGSLREAFVVSTAKQAGMAVYASKEESQGDFILDGMLVEVGGKNKKVKKADYVFRSDIDLPTQRALPLWSLGFIY